MAHITPLSMSTLFSAPAFLGPHGGVLLRESVPKARVSADSLQTGSYLQSAQGSDFVSGHSYLYPIVVSAEGLRCGAVPKSHLNRMVQRDEGTGYPHCLLSLYPATPQLGKSAGVSTRQAPSCGVSAAETGPSRAKGRSEHLDGKTGSCPKRSLCAGVRDLSDRTAAPSRSPIRSVPLPRGISQL